MLRKNEGKKKSTLIEIRNIATKCGCKISLDENNMAELQSDNDPCN